MPHVKIDDDMDGICPLIVGYGIGYEPSRFPSGDD